MDKIAVVILNWNGSGMLRQFLPSVLQYSSGLTPQDHVQVYVADNGSTDDSVAMLRHEFPQVQLLLFSENHGFADGYNLALQQVQAEYVVLLNSDVEVTPQWLQPMQQYLDTHPHVAACQPKIRSYHHRDTFEYAGACGGYLDQLGYPYCRGRIFGTVEKDQGQYDAVAPVFWATGAALFIRLNDYIEAGGLDGRFFAHMEEIDLCWRLGARGRKLVCVPQSVVYHVGGGTLKKENPRKTFLNFRNNLLMLYKNVPDRYLRRTLALRAVLDYVALVKFFLTGDAANACAVWQARQAFRSLRKDFITSRRENLQKASKTFVPGLLRGSILVQYYLRGKHRFSDFQ